MSRRFAPTVGRYQRQAATDLQGKAAVDRRHSAGPTYAFTGTPYQPISDLELDRVIRDQWERDVWVYRAVDARASNASSLEVVIRKGRGMQAPPIPDHPLAELLNGEANPYEPAADFRYRMHTLLDLSVTKGVMVEVTENRGGIERVDILNPLHTWPIPDPDVFVRYFEMRLPDGTVFDKLTPYKRGKGGVLWFKRPHPTDPYQSTSWIRAAGLSIDLDYWARRYNLNFLFNDGRPGGVLAIKSSDEYDGIEEADALDLQAKVSGGPNQAGRIAVLEADHVEYIDMSQSPRDAQYVEGRAITQREILVAAGTPLSVIGDASGRTFDNADAETEGFWKTQMRPELKRVGNRWEQVTGGLRDTSEVFDYDWDSVEVLQRERRRKEQAALADMQAGAISYDEYREVIGREPLDLPGTRVLWLTSGKAPVGDPADVTALLTQGQGSPPPPGGPPPLEGGPEQPALPPGSPPAAPGDTQPPEGDIVDAEIVDPLDESLYATKTLAAVPQDVRDRRRAQHAELIDGAIGDVADELRRLLHRQEQVILTRLRGTKARRHTRHWDYSRAPAGELKVLDPAYIVERATWIQQAVLALKDVVAAAFGAAGQATVAWLGKAGEFDAGEAAAELIARTVRSIAEGFDAKAGHLQDVIAAADAAGDDVETIAGKVRDAYLSADTWADVTSRQVVGAMNAASLIGATQVGALAKRWLATDDERTRPTHREAEGQVVGVGERFDIGDTTLAFPGDPTGDVGEWINCRCTMLYQMPVYDTAAADATLDEDLAGLAAREGGLEWKSVRRVFGGFGGINVTFDPADHPRDDRGRFLDVPDVTLPDGTTGVAVGTDPRGNVVVARADGGTETVKPGRLTSEPIPEPASKPVTYNLDPRTVDRLKPGDTVLPPEHPTELRDRAPRMVVRVVPEPRKHDPYGQWVRIDYASGPSDEHVHRGDYRDVVLPDEPGEPAAAAPAAAPRVPRQTRAGQMQEVPSGTPMDELLASAKGKPERRFELPNGRYAIQQGDLWNLYDGPGKSLYMGDAEGMMTALNHLGIRDENDEPYGYWGNTPEKPGSWGLGGLGGYGQGSSNYGHDYGHHKPHSPHKSHWYESKHGTPHKPKTEKWPLPNGRSITKKGDSWILWDKPGWQLYHGDAEAMHEYLMDHPDLSEERAVKDPDPPAFLTTNDLFKSPADTPERWQLAELPDGRFGQVATAPDSDGNVQIVGIVGDPLVTAHLLDLKPAGPAPYHTSYDKGGERHIYCSKGHRHWGAGGAAGVLVRHREEGQPDRYLMQQRSAWVNHGGTWSTPGGALHLGESPADGAMREATEELGKIPKGMTVAETFTDDHEGWAYHTVVLDSPTMFDTVEADGESLGTRWVTVEEMNKLDLHPGFAKTWPALQADLEGHLTDEHDGHFEHPEDGGSHDEPAVDEDVLDEPAAAYSAVRAAMLARNRAANQAALGRRGHVEPTPDMRVALAGMLAESGIPFDATAEPSMKAGDLAAKSGQTGDGAKARTMIPTVEQIHADGVWRKVNVNDLQAHKGEPVELTFSPGGTSSEPGDTGDHHSGTLVGSTGVHTKVEFADGTTAIGLVSHITDAKVHVDLNAEEAAKEWKRQYNAARFRVRDARLKAAKAAQGKVAGDVEKGPEKPPQAPEVPGSAPEPPKQLDLTGPDGEKIVNTLSAKILNDATADGKPTALYSLTIPVLADLTQASGGKVGPGGVLNGQRWFDVAAKLEDGDQIPVVNLRVQGRMVHNGTVFKFPGVPPILIEHEPGEPTGDPETETGIAEAKLLAKRWGRATHNAAPSLVGLTRGFAWLKGPNPQDKTWAKKTGIKNFESAATGGDGSISLWNHTPTVGLLEHEMGHNIDRHAPGSEPGTRLTGGDGTKHGGFYSVPMNPKGEMHDAGWAQVIDDDGYTQQRWTDWMSPDSGPAATWKERRLAPGDHPILIGPGEDGNTAPTEYARTSIAEDFAESHRLYLKDKALGNLGYMTPAGTMAGSGSGISVRYADLWPERARYFEHLHGHDHIQGTPWQLKQREEIKAALGHIPPDKALEESDVKHVDDGWPAVSDLAHQYMIPHVVAEIAYDEAKDARIAEIKNAIKKAKEEAAAAAAKAAAEAAAEAAYKAKVTDALKALEAAMDAAGKVEVTPMDPAALAKMKKRRAWVKWNAKKTKTTDLPMTGEGDHYTKQDIVAKDKKGDPILKSGGKTLAEFTIDGTRYRGMTLAGGTQPDGSAYITFVTDPTQVGDVSTEQYELMAQWSPLQRWEPNVASIVGHDAVIGDDDVVWVDTSGHGAWVVHPDGSVDTYLEGLDQTDATIPSYTIYEALPNGGVHIPAGASGPIDVVKALETGTLGAHTVFVHKTGGWVNNKASNLIALDDIDGGSLHRIDKIGVSEPEAEKIAAAYEAEQLAQLAAAHPTPAAWPEVKGLSEKQVATLAEGAQKQYDKVLADGYDTQIDPESKGVQAGVYSLEQIQAHVGEKVIVNTIKTDMNEDAPISGVITEVESEDTPSGPAWYAYIDTHGYGATIDKVPVFIGDITSVQVHHAGTPEVAAAARDAYLEEQVSILLLKPEGPAGWDAIGESTEKWDPTLNKKGATWLHNKTHNPLAGSYADQHHQAKSNIAAELAHRLNNEEDWEIFRVYRAALQGAKAGDKYGAVPHVIPEFNQLTSAKRQAMLDQEISNRIGNWASSSCDTNPWSIASQRAIAEEFDTGGEWNPHHMSMQHQLEYGASTTFGAMWNAGGGAFYRRFVRVMYENTQEQFAQAGITEVSLYRGCGWDQHKTAWSQPGMHPVTDQMPGNSWSTNIGTARGFGGGGSGPLLVATFPVSRIFGSARTGFGCWGEWEFTVLNGPGNMTVYGNRYDPTIPQ